MEQNLNRDFKGVWIPKEIWLDKRLTMLEKGILAEIDSLDTSEDGCYASNSYFAEFCQCSETKVSTAISKLIDLDYVYLKSFNGRIRNLKSRLSKSERQTCTNLKADFQKVKANNIYNNTVINIVDKNKTPLPPIGEEVFNLIDHWNCKGIIRHDIKLWLNDKRNARIKKAINQYGLSQIQTAIDHYATVIQDTKYTLFKYKWDLDQFLKQENALPHFLENGSKWLNYCNWKKQNNKSVTDNFKSYYEKLRAEEEENEEISENTLF